MHNPTASYKLFDAQAKTNIGVVRLTMVKLESIIKMISNNMAKSHYIVAARCKKIGKDQGYEVILKPVVRHTSIQ